MLVWHLTHKLVAFARYVARKPVQTATNAQCACVAFFAIGIYGAVECARICVVRSSGHPLPSCTTRHDARFYAIARLVLSLSAPLVLGTGTIIDGTFQRRIMLATAVLLLHPCFICTQNLGHLAILQKISIRRAVEGSAVPVLRSNAGF